MRYGLCTVPINGAAVITIYFTTLSFQLELVHARKSTSELGFSLTISRP